MLLIVLKRALLIDKLMGQCQSVGGWPCCAKNGCITIHARYQEMQPCRKLLALTWTKPLGERQQALVDRAFVLACRHARRMVIFVELDAGVLKGRAAKICTTRIMRNKVEHGA